MTSIHGIFSRNAVAIRVLRRASVAFGAMVVFVLGNTACQPGAQKQAAPEGGPAATTEALGSVQPITLTWDQQGNCVNFQPSSVTIDIGEKVQFNSSVGQSVTIFIPPAAFGADDTTIVVGQGANNTTHEAQTAGTYQITSSPAACTGPGGDVGPVIIVQEGKP
jgi:plastocyanin